MSTTAIPVDVDVLRRQIRETYAEVSTKQEKEFIFPTGRARAQELAYPEPEPSRVPNASVECFAGAPTTGRWDASSPVRLCSISGAVRGPAFFGAMGSTIRARKRRDPPLGKRAQHAGG